MHASSDAIVSQQGQGHYLVGGLELLAFATLLIWPATEVLSLALQGYAIDISFSSQNIQPMFYYLPVDEHTVLQRKRHASVANFSASVSELSKNLGDYTSSGKLSGVEQSAPGNQAEAPSRIAERCLSPGHAKLAAQLLVKQG